MVAFDIFMLGSNPENAARVQESLVLIEAQLSREFFLRPELASSQTGREKPALTLTTRSDQAGFLDLLKQAGAAHHGEAAGPILFILDPPTAAVMKVAGGEHSLLQLLKLYAPDVPIMVIRNPAARPDIRVDLGTLTPPGFCIDQDRLTNPMDFSRQVAKILCRRWAMPFWSALREYAAILDRDSWHTPGHGGGNSFVRSPFLKGFSDAYAPQGSLAFLCDLSVSVDELGDLSSPYQDSPMARAMTRSARIFGAARTLYSTNGSSSANKVILMTLLDPGDVVIMDRNCHKSIHQAMVISGAIPWYVNPRFDEDLGISTPITCDQIMSALTDTVLLQDLEPRAFCLTTCTYEGVLYPIKEIAELCEKAGVVFCADEAWLPHGRFHPRYGPEEGGSAGRYNALGTGPWDSAHLVVQSTHKTLSALSQASMLHVSHSFIRCLTGARHGEESHPFAWLARRFVDPGDFLGYLAEVSRYWISTSPNYPIIASLDCATTQMAGEGFASLSRLIGLAGELTDVARELHALVDLDAILPDEQARRLLGKDPLKFAVAIRPGKDGRGRPHLEAFLQHLMDEEIAWEKYSEGRPVRPGKPGGTAHAGGMVLFQLSMGTGEAQVETLKRVLRESRDHLGWAKQAGPRTQDSTIMRGQVKVVPRDAHYAEGELVPLLEAGGRISCQMVVPYPPGIPSLLPGLEVDPDEAARIHDLATRRESNVHGLVHRGAELCIRVLRPREISALLAGYKEKNPQIACRLAAL